MKYAITRIQLRKEIGFLKIKMNLQEEQIPFTSFPHLKILRARTLILFRCCQNKRFCGLCFLGHAQKFTLRIPISDYPSTKTFNNRDFYSLCLYVSAYRASLPHNSQNSALFSAARNEPMRDWRAGRINSAY
jgi:hypothetical protein